MAYVEDAIVHFPCVIEAKPWKTSVRMVRSWDRTHDFPKATPTLYHRELTMKNERGYLTFLDTQYIKFVYSHLQCMICVHVWIHLCCSSI